MFDKIKELYSTYEPFNNFTSQKVGSNKYKVYDKFSNKKDAAKLLDKINTNLLLLLVHLENKYGNNKIYKYNKFDKNRQDYISNAVGRLRKNYRPFNIQENIPTFLNKDTSYTINKGEVFSLCLRYVDKKEKFHDFNTIMFVALHEFSHLFTKSYGHNTEFWTNFKFILYEAVDLNLYTPVNYRLHPAKYCGITINYCPMYDMNLN